MSRWANLVQHAEDQSKQSALELSAVRQKIAAVESQRRQMDGYRQDYAQRASMPGTVGPIHKLNTIRHFGEQVQLTVSELDAQLVTLRERYEKLRQVWHEHYQRERALKTLESIEARKHAIAADRVSRREEDDFALQARRRRDAE